MSPVTGPVSSVRHSVRQTRGVVIFGRRRDRDPKSGIAAFWEWWNEASARLDGALASGDLGGVERALSSRVQAIHPNIAWELTEGRAARHALILSPEGAPALRGITERWLRAGPGADDAWEFYPSRPADPRAFESELQLGRRTFDPAKSRFGTEIDHGRARVHVQVNHPDFPHLDDADRLRAAFLLLDWALGEDDVERWLGEIRPTGEAQPHDMTGVQAAVKALAAELGPNQWATMEGLDERSRPVRARIRVPFPRVDYPLFDLHGAVTIPYSADPDGQPVDEEEQVLDAIADGLMGRLGRSAVLGGAVSVSGVRTLHLYADHEGVVPDQVSAWATQQQRSVSAEWDSDPGWDILRTFY